MDSSVSVRQKRKEEEGDLLSFEFKTSCDFLITTALRRGKNGGLDARRVRIRFWQHCPLARGRYTQVRVLECYFSKEKIDMTNLRNKKSGLG